MHVLVKYVFPAGILQAKCPSDPIRRVKLLQTYMDLQRINEAYTEILEVEAKEPFPNSLDWYRCIVDIYKVFAAHLHI